MTGRPWRLVYPHQLFEAHLNVPRENRFVLVEHDLFFRQYDFHAHKLVLHRASMVRFADRVRACGYDVDVVESRADDTTDDRLTELVRRLRPGRIEVFDVHDDWLARATSRALSAGGYHLRAEDVLETPGFLTTRPQFTEWFAEHPARMQHFYTWQRRRLGVLVEGAGSRSSPAGGRWSFDDENRKKQLNIGLLTPSQVVDAVLDAADERDVPLASLEGFIRQIIGWREYMRATYHLYARTMRTSNRLEHDRSLTPGWWNADTGLLPVDLVIRRVLDTGYAHHIERLMVLGNAMNLLRVDPTEVYTWFMEMFIDAYDWVMVPNVYVMSQYALGDAMTTKPYVCGSNYLTKMSDLPPGEWRADWDALYWAFVRDHREVFEANHRSRRVPALWDSFDHDRQAAHLARAARLLS